ncbi:transglycosylase domain-containing protein [bacterium]|nr:transglycosylase domain-containing protein [bacterium]
MPFRAELQPNTSDESGVDTASRIVQGVELGPNAVLKLEDRVVPEVWRNDPSLAPWVEWNAQWNNSDYQHQGPINSPPISNGSTLSPALLRPHYPLALPGPAQQQAQQQAPQQVQAPRQAPQPVPVAYDGAPTARDLAAWNEAPQPKKVSAPPNAVLLLPEPESVARRKRSLLVRTLQVGSILILIATLVACGMAYQFIQEQVAELPILPANPSSLLSESSVILASDGSVLGPVFGERRTWVDLEEIAPVAIQALLAAEDHRYFEHQGVDYKRLVGAAWNTFTGSPEGASTITMQLVRNYYPSVKNTSMAERKTREILMSRRISKKFSKEETLELYFNTVAFGSNSFGIEAASKRFFSAKASDLTLSQASLLVGILKGPSKYNPFSNVSEAKSRRNLVINRMSSLGMISTEEADAALKAPLGLLPSIYEPSESIAPHFVDYVRKVADEWAAKNGYDLKADGLTIRTTLDPTLQSAALAAVERQTQVLQNIILSEFGAAGSYANNIFWRSRRSIENDLLRKEDAYRTLLRSGKSDTAVLDALRSDPAFVDDVRKAAEQIEAGFVAIDPHSGQVKAWVGGRDYRVDQFDKVGTAARQPGSVFKPFLYAAALDAGFSPYYLVEDRLKTFVTNTRGERWTPTNSGGGASGRLVTMRQGLAWSKNTVSAHLVSRIGPQRVIDLARKMGVTSPMLPVPSIALGTSETTLLEMAHSYATFADYGMYHNLSVISSIENRNGEVIATFPSEPKRALSAQTAYTMIDMLRDVVDGGTGNYVRTRFGVKGDFAGKTGTTQNNADGWFLAMHPDLVVGAWVGFNDQRIAFQSNYWGQGGHNALLLVGDFLRQTTKGPGAYLKSSSFKPPSGYRYPPKPVYSRPTPEANAKPDLPSIPASRLSPRGAGRLPLLPTGKSN